MDIRSSEPILIIEKEVIDNHRNSKPSKKKRARESREAAKARGYVPPLRPPQIPTPEQYAKSKLTSAAMMRKKYKRPRFYSNQLRHSIAYKHKVLRGQSKVCTVCGKEYGLGAFDLTGDAREVKQARRSYCRFCKRKANKIYYLKRKKRLEDEQKTL